MKECSRCKETFDPAYNFVEEIELLESINRYISEDEIDNFCPDCIYKLDDLIDDAVVKWKNM